MADLEACAGVKQPMVGDGTRISCDIARYGSDSAWAVCTMDGRMIAERSWQNMDLMASVGTLRELMDDLLSTRDEIRSDGWIQIEAKESQRQRVGRSPDAGDALVISLSRDLTANVDPIIECIG